MPQNLNFHLSGAEKFWASFLLGEINMNTDRLLLSLSAGLVVVLTGLLVSLKKPQCIDSKVVDKIDIVQFDKTDTLYKCSSFKKVPYSRYFDENLDQLESRIESVAIFLKNIDSFGRPISIRINQTQPIAFKIQDHDFEIGSQLLESEGHFERGILKIWLSERLKSDLNSQKLFLEVAADFLLFSSKGQVEIEDPILKMKTRVGGARWPQVLKSKDGYCDSPWKISEHFADCGLVKSDDLLNSGLLLSLSLRPLMTSVWIKSYQELSFKEKIKFLRLLPRYLQTQQLSSEKAIEMLLTDVHPLKQGMMNIKKMTDLMNSSLLIQNEKEYREFYSRVAFHLQQAGVTDSFAEAYFDYLVEYPEEISVKSNLFLGLQKIAIQNPQLQMAIKDKHQIWILPNRSGLPITSFDQIKSQQHIYFACLGLKEIQMSQFFTQAEKLLLVRGCDQKKNIDFQPLVAKGIQEFSAKNKQLAFIQFHLPSFEMKAKELAHIKNFFEFVKERDVSKPEFQTLGWRQIQWFEESQAYKPQAVIDAIEMFRTDIN